jgi:hypothetical protein
MCLPSIAAGRFSCTTFYTCMDLDLFPSGSRWD